MKNLSYETQQQIEQLYKSLSFWERIRNPQNDVPSLLVQIQHNAEPVVAPYLIPLILLADKTIAFATAETIHNLVKNVAVIDLIKLDDYVRNSAFYYSVNQKWHKMKPNDVTQLEQFERYSVSLLGICSFHSNGYIRERAVKSLTNIQDGTELPFLLIRLNDWVQNVRNAAYSAIQSRLSPSYALFFVRNLGLALRLITWGREDHTFLFTSIIRLIQSPDCVEALTEGMKSDDLLIKRTSFQIALDTPEISLKEIIERGLKEKDQIIRLRVAQEIGSIVNDNVLQEFLPRLKVDTFMPIRREVLRIVVNRFPEQNLSQLKQALLDKHASIRDEARYQIAKIEEMDFASFYRNVVVWEPEKQLYAAISGLGEVGKKGDDEIVLPFTSHNLIKIRKAAIMALAKLNSTKYVDIFIEALQDTSPGVSREATQALIFSRGHLSNDQQIWQILTRSSLPHVKGNALSLLARLSKWDSIYYLIKTFIINDEDMMQRASSYIDKWRANYNRTFTIPTEDQMKRILDMLTQTGQTLHTNQRKMVEVILKDFE